MKVVFAGPTMHGVSPRQYDGVEIRAPAQFGDIIRAAHDGATSIGVIDGVFEHARSVWHKEILLTLDKGVQIFGAASLGALRAIECEAFGMIGVGEIFEEYRNGSRYHDADVAVTFGPAELGFIALSVSQADVEHTLAAMLAQETISKKDADVIAASSRKIYFKERTIEVIAEASGDGLAGGLVELLKQNWINRKQMDGIELIRAIQIRD